ncbi:MAG: hypothetical protein ACKOLZ_08920, partial [Verrucomicrobiota bacterium]
MNALTSAVPAGWAGLSTGFALRALAAGFLTGLRDGEEDFLAAFLVFGMVVMEKHPMPSRKRAKTLQ